MKTYLIFMSLLALASSNAYDTESLYSGEDSRVFIEGVEKYKSKINKLGLSVAAKIPKNLISMYRSNGILKNITLEKSLNLCSETEFAQELSLAKCGGFLIAPKLLMTAGHCNSKCDSSYWVFDFKKSSISKQRRIKRKNIYTCKKTLSFADNKNGLDYAIVELDREVENFRKPLELNLNFRSKKGSKIFMLGHSEGLPLLYSEGQINSKDKLFFKAAIDSFGSSSGSPVFDRYNKRVIGVLVGGEKDYLQNDNQCRQYLYCDEENCPKGERILKLNSISKLKSFLLRPSTNL